MFLGGLETESERKILEKLYLENRTKLYQIARKIVRNDADAEDAVHTGFMNVAEKYEKYRHLSYIELIRLSTTVIRNAAYDITRTYQDEGEFSNKGIWGEDEIIDEDQDILEYLIKENQKSILVEVVMELPDEERELLYNRYIINLQPREIAELLNISSAEVRMKIFRCRSKLAKVIQKRENKR